jgi:hypothetical protein
MSTTKFVKYIDTTNASLKQGEVYAVLSEDGIYYQLPNNLGRWVKDCFVEVKNAAGDPLEQSKYVRCVDVIDAENALKFGTIYQVIGETDNDYILAGVHLSWDKSRFVEFPKPRKVYQHSRKQIINQLKDLSNTLIGRATFGRVHSLEVHESEVEAVQQDLNDIIARLEQIKETD